MVTQAGQRVLDLIAEQIEAIDAELAGYDELQRQRKGLVKARDAMVASVGKPPTVGKRAPGPHTGRHTYRDGKCNLCGAVEPPKDE